MLSVGDSGASAEGTPNGTFNEIVSLNGAAALETPEFMAEHIDGFMRNGTIVHWPSGFRARGD